MSAVRGSGHEVYLIIDEFDSFANDLLFNVNTSTPDLGLAEYNRAGGAAHASSILRAFGKRIKNQLDVISRIFMTGISPRAFADALSSLNMMTDVSDYCEVEAAVGFTAGEVRQGLKLLYPTQPELVETHFEVMQREYDGYRFHKEQLEGVFNSQLVVYYLRDLHRTGKRPVEIMDINISNQGDVVAGFIVRNYMRKSVNAKMQLLVGSYNTTLMTRGFISASLFDPGKVDVALVTLAYHHGYLTYSDPKAGKGLLAAPNAVFRDVLFMALGSDLGDKNTTDFFTKFAEDNRWRGASLLAVLPTIWTSGAEKTGEIIAEAAVSKLSEIIEVLRLSNFWSN